MKTLEQGSQKIKKICEILKNETIEPAKKEAEAIVAEAQSRAHEIIKEAQKQAEKLRNDARTEIEQERNVFQSSLVQSSRLTLETLKQEIMEKFFNKEFRHLIEKTTADPAMIAKIIEAILKAIEKEGLAANLTVAVAETVSEKEVNALLGEHILNKLKEHSVVLGDMTGGAKVKLQDKNITIEITDDSLMELLAGYASNFRKVIFANK